jgi:two-component sensor histidine kinase/PAS domain-containing protein
MPPGLACARVEAAGKSMNINVKSVVMPHSRDFLQGGGQMGQAIRATDWSQTPLGVPENWPGALKTCLGIMLSSSQPMWVWWGPQLINFYNDAYLPIIGDKHPGALGRPARQVWCEIWHQIEGRIGAAMRGESTYSEAELLVMHRNGYDEETYYTFSFSPVPDADGSIGGIICANTNDTDRVIGARRLALLREIASRTWDADCVAQAYTLAARALSADPRDLPFALLYRLDGTGTHASLAAACGIEAGHAAAPPACALDQARPWPVGEVIRTGRARVVSNLSERLGELPKGPWNDAPHEAVLLPLAVGADSAPRGVLVLAANPYRRRDEAFDNFAVLVARQIASAIVNVEAFEAEHERAKAADVLALEIEHRRRIEQHQNRLLDEMNHRVKNTLATVQSIAVQTLKGVDEGARDSFIARLFALSSQHDLLTMDNWEGASLEGVLRLALRPWREEDHARVALEGPAVHLDPKRALALGMAFHELATNAARHGALSNAEGHVRASWTAGPTLLRFRWQECGGPRVDTPTRRGFGLRLIEHGLARELSGKVRMIFDPKGFICEWEMVLP